MPSSSHYLKALKKRVGYLINFGHHPSLEWEAHGPLSLVPISAL